MSLTVVFGLHGEGKYAQLDQRREDNTKPSTDEVRSFKGRGGRRGSNGR